jgi:hypothetical protein
VSVAVTLVDRVGRPLLATAVVVPAQNTGSARREFRRWSWLLGPATSFPDACGPDVALDLRQLMCPDPWTELGYVPPAAVPSGLGFAQPADAADLRAVHWDHIRLPGSVCGADGPISLRGGTATIWSAVQPWWRVVHAAATTPVYGSWRAGRWQRYRSAARTIAARPTDSSHLALSSTPSRAGAWW